MRVAAIAGWTCAGKTRFARALADRFPGWEPVVLSQDDYYRDTSHLSRSDRTEVNYDEPESYDLDRFAEHLGTLRSGGTVPRFSYHFGSGARRISGSLGPTNLVVAEGVLPSGIPGSGRRRTSGFCWRGISMNFSEGASGGMARSAATRPRR